MRRISTPNEELRVGDMVYVLGVRRIAAIRPYRGPHEFIFGIADTVPGVGFSLERGGYTDVICDEVETAIVSEEVSRTGNRK